jgi:hypothetical protein
MMLVFGFTLCLKVLAAVVDTEALPAAFLANVASLLGNDMQLAMGRNLSFSHVGSNKPLARQLTLVEAANEAGLSFTLHTKPESLLAPFRGGHVSCADNIEQPFPKRSQTLILDVGEHVEPWLMALDKSVMDCPLHKSPGLFAQGALILFINNRGDNEDKVKKTVFANSNVSNIL